MLIGYLLQQLLEAATRLWPDFQPERREMVGHPIEQRASDPEGFEPWRPVWRRDREDGQSLVEYALILALIAIVAIVALAFLGGAVASALSSLGQSI